MNRATIARLLTLESQQAKAIPSYEEFASEWAAMDPLSRALFGEICASPANYRREPRQWRRYLGAVRSHLQRMGMLSGDIPPSIQELAQQLDHGGGDVHGDD
jgi:hypothetical protein